MSFLRHLCSKAQPRQTPLGVNPFNDLLYFASGIFPLRWNPHRFELPDGRILLSPEDFCVINVMDLHALEAKAMHQWARTGFPAPEVEKRVRRLSAAVFTLAVLGYKTMSNELTEDECEFNKIVEPHLTALLDASLAVQSLAETFDGESFPAVTSVAPESGPDDGAKAAKPLLVGWHEIAAALEMKYNQHDNIKRLNQGYEGPIVIHGNGGRPMVYREKLLEWWNHLAVKERELSNQRAGAKLSGEAQHNFGRNGTAAPEVNGEVKKRRKDKLA